MSRPARGSNTLVSRTIANTGASLVTLLAILLIGSNDARGVEPPGLVGLDALYPSLDALYLDLHRNPELSLHEERTAAEMAARLRAAGFEVTEHVGGCLLYTSPSPRD